MRSFKYLFGPVPSRRLGMSLGVDLVPHKTCPFNCVYCECGETTELTTQRKEYIPTSEVLEELRQVLSTSPDLDYITFSGAGEPLLHIDFGKILRFLKSNFDYKVCLLTNGILLGNENVSRELSELDLIVPSLDAVNETQFKTINRPEKDLTCDALIDGLIAFRNKNPQIQFHLEIFVVPGINDSDDSIMKFVEVVKKIHPDQVQINSLDRPGCVDWIQPAEKEICQRFLDALTPVVPTKIVAKFKTGKSSGKPNCESLKPDEQQILELISRRPMTVTDIAVSLSLDEQQIQTYLQRHIDSGDVICEISERGKFYRSKLV